MALLRPDILVIGLDPAGVECALAAAAARLSVVLITQGQVGARLSGGLDPLKRFAALGGRLIDSQARFRDRRHVFVEGDTIAARRVVLALAAGHVVPPVPGLQAAPRWTPGQAARSVLVFGAGGRAPAVAEAIRAQGARAAILAPARFLPGFDAEASAAMLLAMRRGAIDCRTDIVLEAAHVTPCPEGFLFYPPDAAPLGFSHWCSTIRAPTPLDALRLEEAGVAQENGLARCGDGFATTNPYVYAVGATRSAMADSMLARAEAGMALAVMLGLRADGAATSRLPKVAQGALSLIEAGQENTTPTRRRFYRQPLPGGGHLKVETDSKGRVQRFVVLGRHAAALAAPLQHLLEDQRPLAHLARLPLPAVDDVENLSALGVKALAETLSRPLPRLWMWLRRMMG